MGGRMSMLDWLEADLARDDYVHLTRRGYELVARAILEAIMPAALEEAERPDEAEPPSPDPPADTPAR